ncbi:MAG: L-threonylcarbamoyladenylate synthase [Clostridia bacterium]|nr:L-threonylcarbamoyladenylate synthase [Clostridia bacterium]
MKTEIIRLDFNNIDSARLRYAANILKNGGLVAFPTETVYGLGANALDETAVRNIFKAKGRPNDNPLIVHIAEKKSLSSIVSHMPSNASLLMDKFWPGPLTLVMPKSNIVPPVITAGLETVAVRMPLHPIALALIKEAGVPVAAPSANTSGKPSPTTAKHVIEDLSGKVDIIIDAGSAQVGLESTVLDITVSPAMILRPGGVTSMDLERILGIINVDPAILTSISESIIPKSPGMKYTHYSPKADVIVIDGNLSGIVAKIRQLLADYSEKGIKAGILATDQTIDLYALAKPVSEIISVGDRTNPETIASSLFKALRTFDEKGVDVILAEAVDKSGIGMAIMNRLNKAAGYKIIHADND